MIIGIDASRANNIQKTGVEWYAFFLIQELKKIVPQDVNIVLYSERPLEGDLSILPSNWSAKILSWPPKRFWTQIRLSYEMLVSPPDVLFIPAHVFPLIHPKKTVMTIHDVAALRFPTSYNWFERWYSLWSAKYAVKNLWRVIVPSIFTKKELETLCLKTDTVSVVYHGFEQKYLEEKTPEHTRHILDKYALNPPFFLVLGRLEEKKNTQRIIEAFQTWKQAYSKYEHYQLVFIGKPGFGFDTIVPLLEKSKNKDEIKVLGWLPSDETGVLLKSAEALLFPSLYEGFGLPILEAFATQTPVITSDNSSTQEIGGDAVILVNPHDTENIVEAMKTVIENKNLKDTLIQKGAERLSHFSWEKCAEETLKILL